MAYVYPNFKYKKQLKQAVKDGRLVTARENTPWGQQPIKNGNAFIEGPHFPEPHTWYAQVVVKDGFVTRVK